MEQKRKFNKIVKLKVKNKRIWWTSYSSSRN